MPGSVRTWTDAQLLAAIAGCTNFTDVVRALGLRAAGGNHLTVKRHAKRLHADTSHFTNDRRLRGIRAYSRHRAPTFEEIFRRDSRVSGQTVRRYALLFNVRRFACAECGNPGAHNGKPLTLQLDHANGIYNDNRVENLRWLCPNCHSQTETFAGRRSRHGYRIMRDGSGGSRQPRVSEPAAGVWYSTCRTSAPYQHRPTPRPDARLAG